MIKKENIIHFEHFNNTFIDDIKTESVYFDIETNGLSPKTASIISITYLIYRDNNYKVIQYFASDELDENEMLVCFFHNIKNLKYAISYNGKTFDTNFIDEKFRKYNILFSLRCLEDIDIYRFINNFRKVLPTSCLKLKHVEELLGIYRKDEISGKDVINIFNAYTLNHKSIFIDFILDHNYEDVIYLPRILDYVLNLFDYKYESKNYGLVLLKKITFQKQHLRADFFCTKKGIMSTYNSIDSKITYSTKNENLCVSFDIKRYKKDTFKMIYTNNNFEIDKFQSIENLKKNIIPLMINERDFKNNIYAILNKILTDSDI